MQLARLGLVALLSTTTLACAQPNAQAPAGLEEALAAAPWIGVSATGRKILEAAALNGDPRAMANLAVAHVNGQGGPQDFPAARRWYGMAAQARSSHGAHGLGLLTYNGQGGPRDEVLGLALLQLAREADRRAGEAEPSSSLPQVSPDLQQRVNLAKQEWVARYGQPCAVVGTLDTSGRAWSLAC